MSTSTQSVKPDPGLERQHNRNTAGANEGRLAGSPPAQQPSPDRAFLIIQSRDEVSANDQAEGVATISSRRTAPQTWSRRAPIWPRRAHRVDDRSG